MKNKQTTHPWWKTAVFYQIYPRSFCDSNNDGIGDIPGIISKLDYLKDLGINALWLSPVYKSPNTDFGYDVADYRSINPEYGTMADMEKLIAEAAKRDIKIIMDLVANHTSDEHEWFQKGRDPQSPHHDYYIWKEGKKDWRGKEVPPNNWASFFSGSAWTKDDTNGKYYLHLFAKKQPDLNYRNPKVIEEIKDIMRFWLDKGVAGFRCDVINLIYKKSFTDGKGNPFYIQGSEHYLSTAGGHRILKEIHREVLEPYGAFTVGETAGVNLRSAKRFVKNQLSTVFSFDHVSVDHWKAPTFRIKYQPEKLKAALLKWQRSGIWNTLFFENHDQPRSVSRFGDSKKYHAESGKMLATLLLTLPGTPFIYEGQEIGMTDPPARPAEDWKDIAAINTKRLLRSYGVPRSLAYRWASNVNRDNARTPMQWSNQKNGGFSKVDPWLPVNPNASHINVSASQNDPSSILNFYKQLIAFRQRTPAFLYGAMKVVNSGKNIFSYTRHYKNDTYLVVINMDDARRRSKIKFDGELLFSNYTADHDAQYLRPFEVRILKR